MKVIFLTACFFFLMMVAQGSASAITPNYSPTSTWTSRVVFPSAYTVTYTGANQNEPIYYAVDVRKDAAAPFGNAFVCNSVGKSGAPTSNVWQSNWLTNVANGFPAVNLYLTFDSLCRIYVLDSNGYVGQLNPGSSYLLTDNSGKTVHVFVGSS